MTRPAPSCFSEDNTRAEAMSGHAIYQALHTGPGTSSLQTAANTATSLERSYAQIESRLKRVGETLGESWVGASATAAIAAGNPINQATVQMQDALRQADHSFSNQIYQFNYDKARLKNMPENKPDTNFWDDATPWDTDTEDAVNGYNKDESHNRQVYTDYQRASRTNRGELPTEMAGITADNLNIEITDPGGNGVGNSTNTSGVKSPTGTGGWQNPGSPTIPGPQGQVTPPGTITGGDDTRTSWSGGGDGGGLTKPGELGNNVNKPPIGGPIERPNNIGVPPFGLPPGTSGGLNAGGRGPGGGGGAGGGRGPGAGGLGGAGKFGGGGGLGTGTGTGSTSTSPGGKAGVLGSGMGEHGPNARGGVAGAAGRAGAAGAGGMGAGAQRGQGDEDKEHKSADYLVNDENTNEIIGDMPMVAPPTIGE